MTLLFFDYWHWNLWSKLKIQFVWHLHGKKKKFIQIHVRPKHILEKVASQGPFPLFVKYWTIWSDKSGTKQDPKNKINIDIDLLKSVMQWVGNLDLQEDVFMKIKFVKFKNKFQMFLPTSNPVSLFLFVLLYYVLH